MVTKSLTIAGIRAAKAPGRYRDAQSIGLYLNVAPDVKGTGVTKSWVYRFMLAGRSREMGLGPVSIIGLAEARDLAREAKRQVVLGRDPIAARDEERDKLRVEQGRRLSFKEAAERCIAARSSGWRNEKHKAQWSSTIERYAFPALGSKNVADIDVPDILKVLTPIWLSKHETASRLRQRIEVVLDWAKAGRYRTGDNPATIKGPLAHLLPAVSADARRAKHHPAMAWADVPEFLVDLRENDSISARALEFTILTAKRTGEIIGARWPEIDAKAKVWTIPAGRMKSGREHRVPLTDRCLKILEDLPTEPGNPHVFIGGRAGKGLSNMALLQLLKGMDGNGYTVHGFRSSFKDWAAESTAFPGELSEAQLAHVLKDQTQAAYERGDKLEKRRAMMQAWEQYCAAPPRPDADNVVPMRSKS